MITSSNHKSVELWLIAVCSFLLFVIIDYLLGHISQVQYIPRNMHTVFALLCFVVVIHWLIFPYPSGLLHWHCGNLTIAPVPAKQPSMNMDKYFMWIHYERLHNHNKAKHNKTVCIFVGMYCRTRGLTRRYSTFPKSRKVLRNREQKFAMWQSLSNLYVINSQHLSTIKLLVTWKHKMQIQ